MTNMSATENLIQLLGAVALLLWGLFMVHTGITRGFGAQLRHVVNRSVANRVRAFLAGMGVTMVMQSSTATALIVASFASRGLIDAAPAFAVMLGADVGTTLVAQVLSFDLSFLSPLLLVVGVVMHKTLKRTIHRQIGRAAIGLGLMLLALTLIVHTSEPMREAPVLRALFTAMSDEPIIALVLTAILTWLAHSSLAVVLLVMSYASTGVVPVPLALVMVLGANLGGTLPPILATLNEGAMARRVTFGNAAFRVIGVAVCLPLIELLPDWLAGWEGEAARQVINFHTAFNLGVALVFILLVPFAARIAARLMPPDGGRDSSDGARFLDATALDSPAVALSCAAREVLRMGETVERMVNGVSVFLRSNDTDAMARLIETDSLVDRQYEDVKLYVTKIARQEVDATESHRMAEILSFATNLEYIGDIAENLLGMLVTKAKKQLRFSEEGMAELADLHAKGASNLKVAMAVFMSGDVAVARQLVGAKRHINALERRYAENHMERLRQERPESIETSGLHMDMLRDLRRLHSHITAGAYPILEAAGELRKSRLKKRHANENSSERKTSSQKRSEEVAREIPPSPPDVVRA